VCRFSSRYDEDIPPVVSFAYQEPENDPRHFGYLWVVRGCTTLLSTALQSVYVHPAALISCYLLVTVFWRTSDLFIIVAMAIMINCNSIDIIC